jgi:hypothetical protein
MMDMNAKGKLLEEEEGLSKRGREERRGYQKVNKIKVHHIYIYMYMLMYMYMYI